jgi:multicomponent Na+:H+ antiporter subunit A
VCNAVGGADPAGHVLLAILALHVVLGALAFVWGRRLGRHALVLCALAPATAVVVLFGSAGRILSGHPLTSGLNWVPRLGLRLDFRVDAFSLLLVFLVSGIGVLVFAYARSYFTDPRTSAKVAGLLVLFAGSMLGVVTADNILLLFVCWELTSITSYLLIGLNDTTAPARAAALQALLITALGGLALLGGLVLLGQQAGSYRLSEILTRPPHGAVTNAALVLVLVGAFTKSAQYPFHSWLPAAMAAPTPISAYLHSAAMVKAGVYLVARFAPAFATAAPWRPLVLTVGLFSMVAGGLRALRPTDLKQVLAFGTLSQLGFLMVLFGIGRPETTVAGCILLLAHGVFKAGLFMAVGVVDHVGGTRDIYRLPRLSSGWLTLRMIVVVCAASMAAVPPLLGFIAKEYGYAALLDGGQQGRWVLVGVVAGSVLTVAYSARLVAAFVQPSWWPGDTARAADSPRAWFVAPATVLATVSVIGGLVPALWSWLVEPASRALVTLAPSHIALWHGFNPALGLSIVTLALGTVTFAGSVRRDAVDAAMSFDDAGGAGRQTRSSDRLSGAAVFERLVTGVLGTAGRVTAVVQSGSLPIYLAVILTTVSTAPLVALLGGGRPGSLDLAGPRWLHIPVAVALVTAAVATTLARRRFAAALMLGAVGYSMTLLFVISGAPDLALTQFGVETLSVVAFLLVLRSLPDRFDRRSQALHRGVRLAVAGSVGALVIALGLVLGQPPSRVSDQFPELALTQAHGQNVVNVILVDIRGLDTLGEVTVLVVAAIGVAALARAGKHRKWHRGEIAGSDAAVAPGGERSVILATTTRLVFDAALVFSIYLLFAGHQQPGGGFVGGLIAAAALALRYVTAGLGAVRATLRIPPWYFLAAGLIGCAGWAVAGVVGWGVPLRQLHVEYTVAVLGHVAIGTAALFDAGVYLIVIGMAAMLFESFDDADTPAASVGVTHPDPSIQTSDATLGGRP